MTRLKRQFVANRCPPNANNQKETNSMEYNPKRDGD